MRRLIVLLLLSSLVHAKVHADYDAALEAQEQAARDAAAAERAAQEQAMRRMREAGEAKAHADAMARYRQSLGAAADGKSDAEVMQLLEQRQREALEMARHGQEQAEAAMQDPRNAEALKSITGKSMEELQNMSDEDAEALARELEQKYGN